MLGMSNASYEDEISPGISSAMCLQYLLGLNRMSPHMSYCAVRSFGCGSSDSRANKLLGSIDR